MGIRASFVQNEEEIEKLKERIRILEEYIFGEQEDSIKDGIKFYKVK